MNPWYATNARQLLQTRQQGQSPTGPVVVSLIGGTFPQRTLHVRPDMPVDRLDWRMLVNLQVWVWAGPAAALDWAIATTARIALARPASLHLRFAAGDELHDVEVGQGLHLPAVLDLPATHDFCWSPVNVGATEVGKRLRRALIARHPIGASL